MPNLDCLLNPSSIAIVGASNNTQKIGGIVLKNIIDSGYQGQIYPLNLKEQTVQGLAAFTEISKLPEVPDLCIFAIPSNILLPVLEDAGKKQIKNILIFSAGFKETGEEGKVLETKLLAIANQYLFNLLGPNCLGFLNNSANLNATFGKVSNQKGNLRLLSQSGAIATSIFDWAEKSQLGIDQFITLGNKSVLNENHFLDHWSTEQSKSDYDTTGLSENFPIGLYLESISDGKSFLNLCQKITSQNPIFIIKPGKTEGAKTAMMSHTGSLAGSNDVLETALTEAGVIHTQTLEEFFNLAKFLSWENAPKGPNLAIISNAGGPAVISADAVSENNLQLATISKSTTKKLTELLPRMAGLHNPVDVLGDALADRYAGALEEVLKEQGTDSVLVILTPQIMTEIQKTAKIIGELSKKYQKPIVCSFIGGDQINIGEKTLNDYKIPNFPFPEQAIKSMSLAYQWSKYQQSIKINAQTSNVFSPSFSISQIDKTLNTSGLQDPQTSSFLLELAQINEPSSIVTDNLNVAKEFAVTIGWPVVLKIASKDIVHKSDGGGVATNINSLEKLTAVWDQMSKISKNLQVQKQISSGQELILGFKRDNIFGDTFFFGAGGKYVSLLQDKNLCLFPLEEAKLRKLIKFSKIFPLLNGFRGDIKLDIEKIVSLVRKLGFIFEHLPKIKEMEINPAIINQDNIYCVDTKIILK